MIYNEAFDHLWAQMAGGMDRNAVRRLKDYQRKRLCRAMLARCVKPYLLEASWVNAAGTAGELTSASTTPVTQPLMVLDGTIRTTDIGASGSADNNNFSILLARTGGNSRVQVSQDFVKDEHVFTPAQLPMRNVITNTILGYGQSWPNTWPVPLDLLPNELLQVRGVVLAGGVPAGETTFVQFRCAMIDAEPGDDLFESVLRKYIEATPVQKPKYLGMFSDGAHSIVYPATGTLQRTTAKTRETDEPILITGYSTLFARGTAGGNGSTCDPKWQLSSSNGYTFSNSEIDVNTYAYAAPGQFWQELPFPFLLPAGSSLSASFSTRGAIANESERIDNYVIFRGVSV